MDSPLGIISVVLNLLKIAAGIGEDPRIIGDGIFGVILSGLLIYGAHQHKTIPITIYMIFSIIESTFLVVLCCIMSSKVESAPMEYLTCQHCPEIDQTVKIVVIIFFIGIIFFNIGTIFVAKWAKKEIKEYEKS